MSWSWKTKPRSIIKTVQWFPYFAALEGENWNKKSSFVSKNKGKPVHPVRRSYIYSAHGDEDTWLSSISYKDYLSGQKDTKETEANGRMDKGAFEFFGFGYVKDNGEIAVSEVGNKIVHGTFDDEAYFVKVLSKTKEERENILSKFQDILANEDMSALWLEGIHGNL